MREIKYSLDLLAQHTNGMADLMSKPTKKEIEKWEAEEMPKHLYAAMEHCGLESALGLAQMYIKNNGSPLGKELSPFETALFKFIRNSV